MPVYICHSYQANEGKVKFFIETEDINDEGYYIEHVTRMISIPELIKLSNANRLWQLVQHANETSHIERYTRMVGRLALYILSKKKVRYTHAL